MAEPRADRPYVQFNFRVNLELPGMDPNLPIGGFQEVSGMGMELAVAEYRRGNDKTNAVTKVVALAKASDVTCKRGVIGTTHLADWLSRMRDGKDESHNVTIELLSEDRARPVMTWRLTNARIIKYTCGPLNAKGNDIAMEEMVLSHEFLRVE